MPQPSEAAILGAVEWAKAHGTFKACATAEEMFRHAEAWCSRPELIRAVVGEHHVAGIHTTYDFVLAPATGELATPDGAGLTIYLAGLGLLRTIPATLLNLVRALPDATLREFTEAIATARTGDPGATTRVSLYLTARPQIRAMAAAARGRGTERPVVLVIDVRDPMGRSLVSDAKAEAALSAAEADDIPLVMRAVPWAALMHPDSPLPDTGREFLSNARDCSVIVVASGDTSYFVMPFESEPRRAGA